MPTITLTVEDGTVVTSANTYYSLASADEYFEQRGNSTWIAYDNNDKTYALIKACQYMENLDWKGVKSLSDQELVWPRIGMETGGYAIDSNEIPKKVKWAQAEIAYNYIVDTDIEPNISAGAGAVKSEQVDVIKVEYFSGKGINKTYQRVNSLLREFLKYGNSGIVIELIRS